MYKSFCGGLFTSHNPTEISELKKGPPSHMSTFETQKHTIIYMVVKKTFSPSMVPAIWRYKCV